MIDKKTWGLIIKELILFGDSEESFDLIPNISFDKDKCLSALNVIEVPFDTVKQPYGVLGYAVNYDGYTGAIGISDKNKYPIKTVMHEVAHTQLHIKDVLFQTTLLEEEKKAENYVVTIAEIEAECTAFILTSVLGLEGSRNSLQYIERYSSKFRYGDAFYEEKVKKTEQMVERILTTAEAILEAGKVYA